MEFLTEALIEFCRRIESADVPYVIGGSIASSIWGNPRATNDVDVEVWLSLGDGAKLIEAFRDRYLISESEIRDAQQYRGPFPVFQILDQEEILKFDCFIMQSGTLDRELFDASELIDVRGFNVRIASAEHIVLQKLRWFESGNRVSERQWRDMVSVVRTKENFNWDILSQWAFRLNLLDLVASLRGQSSI